MDHLLVQRRPLKTEMAEHEGGRWREGPGASALTACSASEEARVCSDLKHGVYICSAFLSFLGIVKLKVRKRRGMGGTCMRMSRYERNRKE